MYLAPYQYPKSDLMTVSWVLRGEREPSFIDVPQERREGEHLSYSHQPPHGIDPPPVIRPPVQLVLVVYGTTYFMPMFS